MLDTEGNVRITLSIPVYAAVPILATLVGYLQAQAATGPQTARQHAWAHLAKQLGWWLDWTERRLSQEHEARTPTHQPPPAQPPL